MRGAVGIVGQQQAAEGSRKPIATAGAEGNQHAETKDLPEMLRRNVTEM